MPNLYSFMLDIFLLLCSGYDLIVFYNKYNIVEFYYYVYVNLYIIYKLFKNFFILGYFNMLKIYIIFINDVAFFKVNNFIIILLFKLKKFIKLEWKYVNKRIFKLHKKYKNYYKFEVVGPYKLFLFLALFILFVLIWRNRTLYYRIALIFYPFLCYVLVLYLCHMILPFLYYKAIGATFIIIFVFLLFSLKLLNHY